MDAEMEERLRALEQALDRLAVGRDAAAQTIAEVLEPSGTFQTSLGRAADAANAVLAIKKQVEGDQAVIATKSDHIQKAQEHADAVRANLDRALTAATASATEAEGLKSRAQSAADSAAELVAATTARKTAAEADASATATAKESVDKLAATLKTLSDRAVEAEKRVAAYEEKLRGLEEEGKKKLQEIVELLPGAASAGLATAFHKRRKTFLLPTWGWQAIFVGAVVVLALLAHAGLKEVIALQGDSLGGVWKAWLARLPIAAALIWLALHAAREAALAQRLEEDYGYKAAIAASFMGFNEQMMLITKEEDSGPLGKLCVDTLRTIATPPGRIYDKHRLTHTPLDQWKAMLEGVIDRARGAPTK